MSRKNLTRFLGVVLSALCLAFFFVKARSAWEQAGSHIEWRQAWPRLTLGLGPYMLAYIIFASNWHLLMRTLGDRGKLMTSWGVFLTAQFGKYLPGNIGHHAGRVAIGMKHGQSASQIIMTMLIETIVALTVAGSLSLSMAEVVLKYLGELWDRQRALIITFLMIAIILATILTIAVNRYYWLRRLRTWIERNFGALRSRHAIWPITFCVVMTFVALSLSSTPLLLLSVNAPEFNMRYATYAAGLFCAAWMAGMFTPGAPAGLGVREVILVQGLTPLTGQVGAVITTILFRVLTVAADLLAFIVGLMLLKLFPGKQDGTT